MNKLINFLLISALFIFQTTAQETGNNTMHNEKLQIINTVESMTTALNNKDADKIMTFYQDNNLIAFEPEQIITNNEQAKLMFEEFFHLSPKFSYPNGHQVYVVGDTALHISPWKMSATTPDGEHMEQAGLSVAVLKQQPDGRWLIVIDDPNGSALLN